MQLQDTGIDACLADRLAERPQELKTTGFDGALALVVNEESTLLGLLRRMMTNSYKRGNYMVERIDIIIEYNQDQHAEIAGENGHNERWSHNRERLLEGQSNGNEKGNGYKSK